MLLWTHSKSLNLASHSTLYFPSHIAFFYALSVIFIYCFSLLFQFSLFVYCTASCVLSIFSWRSYPLFNELHSAIFLLLLLFLITSISMEKTISYEIFVLLVVPQTLIISGLHFLCQWLLAVPNDIFLAERRLCLSSRNIDILAKKTGCTSESHQKNCSLRK